MAGFFDYVKKAFFIKPNIPSLGEVPVNVLAVFGVAVLGLLNPGFWLLGAGLEVGYLALVSSDPRFRKWADAIQQASASGDQQARKMAILRGLTPPRQMRYNRLEASCAQMLQSSRNFGGKASVVDQQTCDSLNRLLWIFLNLLVSSQMLEAQLVQTPRERLEQEIEAYEHEYAKVSQEPGKEAIAKSLEGTLEIARKRMANLKTAFDRGQYFLAELHRIEQQVQLILQEAAMAKDSSALIERLDAVTQTFNQTQDWMKSNAALLGSDESDLDTPPPIFQTQ
ncbi:MAG: hypothetical protein FJX76_21615 [Armatimonadetes bacterium]|nr:hypothetical protein [Armatimonadota bacterium]